MKQWEIECEIHIQHPLQSLIIPFLLVYSSPCADTVAVCWTVVSVSASASVSESATASVTASMTEFAAVVVLLPASVAVPQ